MTDTLSLRSSADISSAGDRHIRTTLFVTTFMLIWVTTTPFIDLGDPKLLESANEGHLIGQLAMLALSAAMIVFVARHKPHILVRAITISLVLTLAWFTLSALYADHSNVATRRVILATLTIFQAAVFLLLASSREEFGRLLGICALIVLALCYAGVAVAPGLSIHQASDVREPELAGAWRGVFGHKNGAGGAMAVLIFTGLFVRQTWDRRIGTLIVVLAAVFLYLTKAKSPLGLLPVVLLIVWLIGRTRLGPLAIFLLLLAPVVVFAMTIGSVVYDPISDVLDAYASDPSFTGRDVIWLFAIDQAMQRPFVGFGFNAFWGTSELLEAWNPQESWGMRATDAHNGPLNLAVTVGFVGMALALIWIVVQPLRDYLIARARGADPVLTTFFMQVWLFGVSAAGFESVFFAGGSGLWFMMVVAIIGLRFQGSFELKRVT